MKLSIITPVFNDPRVSRSLESIRSQQCEDELELIVIDGGSNAPTLEALEGYRNHISILVSEPDKGIYDAMNKGIALATGQVIGILNADDLYYDPFVLRDIAETFRDPKIEACYGDLIYVDNQDNIVRKWESGKYNAFKYYFGWMPPHPTFYVRRMVYERYGIFDLRYPIAADYELMLRFILKNRISLKYIPRVLVKMSLGGMSNRSLKNIIAANLEVRRAWKNNNCSFGYFVPLLKPAQKILQFAKK